MESLWCLDLGRHSGSRSFQPMQRRDGQWTAIQVDIGLKLKINISNIEKKKNVIMITIIISIDLMTMQDWY